MNLDAFLDWTVSIDCGSTIGNYQGQIQSVDQLNQTLTLTNTFHNGISIHYDQQHCVVIQAKDILDLKLLSQPHSPFQIPKTIQKKSHSDQVQPSIKAVPIVSHSEWVHSVILLWTSRRSRYSRLVTPCLTSLQ